MSCLNYQTNRGRQLLGLTLAAAMLISLFVVTSYSGTRSRPSSITRTNGSTSPLTQSQAPALKANGKIAFTSHRDDNGEIYAINPDGSRQTRLTNNPAEDDFPAWSPDGSKIAFASNRDGHYEIYLMNADGSSQTRLTNSQADAFYPDWSPDGAKIVFTRIDGGAESLEIYAMNADGSNQTRLTNNQYKDWEPTWSPDGTRIAFKRQETNTCCGDIYLMSADAAAKPDLHTIPVRASFVVEWIAVSRPGHRTG